MTALELASTPDPRAILARLEALDEEARGLVVGIFERVLRVFEQFTAAPATAARPYVPPCALRLDSVPRKGRPEQVMCERHWHTFTVAEGADWPERCPAGQAEAAAVNA